MKKILFIGISYKEYTNEIISSIKEYIGDVLYFNIDIKRKYRWIQHVNNFLYQKLLKKLHNKIIQDVKEQKFNYIFFLQVHQMAKRNVMKLKNDHPEAYFILYNWDSLDTHNYLEYIPLFDKVLSFDPQDCKKYPEITYLPLFFMSSLKQNQTIDFPNKYDCVFIGHIYRERRYLYLENIRKYAKENNLIFYEYCTVAIKTYITYLVRNKQVMKGVHFKTIAIKDIMNIYNKAMIIFDIPNNTQSGLTMRVFEVLAMNRKLATTNVNVKNEPFYDCTNIHVFNIDDIFFPAKFIQTPYKMINCINDYSLSMWINKIFEVNNL